MIRKALALWGLLLLTCTLTRAADFPVMTVDTAAPASANAKPSLSYKLFRSVIFDIDEQLQQIGLSVRFCRYIPNHVTSSTVYNGLGPCLEKNFRAAMKTKGLTGVIQAWVQTSQGQLLPLQVNWRPTEEGYKKLLREILDLKFERKSHRQRSEPTQQPLRYTQNFIGHLQILFPENVVLSDYFAADSDLPSILGGTRYLNFTIEPLYKKAGKVHYSGEITVNTVQFQFLTNINIFKTARPFQTSGSVDIPGAASAAGVHP